MKSRAWPVSRKPGASKREVLHDEDARRADRLDRQRAALDEEQRLLVAELGRDGRRDDEQDQPEVGEQRRQLRVLVAVAVEVAWRPSTSSSRTLNRCRRRTARDLARVHAGHRRPVGQLRVVERLRLDDADLARLSPQPRRPVERADDDRDREQQQREREPGRGEDLEDLEPLERVHEPDAENRVVAVVDLGHRGDVVRRRAERERRQLTDRHPDRPRAATAR